MILECVTRDIDQIVQIPPESTNNDEGISNSISTQYFHDDSNYKGKEKGPETAA